MTCKHECLECGWQWDCAFPDFEDCESLSEAQEYGFACNDICPQCDPIAYEDRINDIREEELAAN